ncbi:MAG: glycoside hydrolase family 3 protein, partial [Clostridia bacterium]|nr:glycoside hydrolase family 3 protein [Clostridia bacterium]
MSYPYQDPALTPEERARDLLGRMTPREKLMQMCLRLKLAEKFDSEQFDKDYPDGLGATYSTITLSAAEINRMQKHMVEHTRLGIPMLMMSESLHGFFCDGATVYPQALGLGATFDPELIGRIAAAIGKQVRGMGVTETFAPNLDLSQDPRWGRVEENYGEDPYLTSRMGVAYVRGIQSQGVAACPKHYVAHGAPQAGI